MQNGSHFTEPTSPAPQRFRRAAGLACGAIAVGAVAMLAIDVTGGSSHVHKVGLTSSSQGIAPLASTAPTTAAPTTAAPTTAAPSTTSTIAPTSTTAAAPAAQLPDGSALPVLVVFDGGTITLAGSVPNEAAAKQLHALALANSKSAAQVIDHLVVDPKVPPSVGVRVIEMNAVRFSTGSSQINADYAPELARVISLMKAMPWVSTLVIGHADQSGLSALNLQLSQARANAIIDYLVSQGISPDRLSGQGVGDREPLTTQTSTSALALNRRTEFVFYGLFANKAR